MQHQAPIALNIPNFETLTSLNYDTSFSKAGTVTSTKTVHLEYTL